MQVRETTQVDEAGLQQQRARIAYEVASTPPGKQRDEARKQLEDIERQLHQLTVDAERAELVAEEKKRRDAEEVERKRQARKAEVAKKLETIMKDRLKLAEAFDNATVALTRAFEDLITHQQACANLEMELLGRPVPQTRRLAQTTANVLLGRIAHLHPDIPRPLDRQYRRVTLTELLNAAAVLAARPDAEDRAYSQPGLPSHASI